MNKTDRLYANPLPELTAFQFDASVAAVFADMIKRSVPGYEAIIAMIGELAGRYGQAGTNCYDLGCSLGAASLAMAEGLHDKSCKIIGVDNSAEMLERCRTLLANSRSSIPIELVYDDVCSVAVDDASIIVLNFTLQFIPLTHRQNLINRLHQSLVPGGVLIVSEKICFADAHHQQLMTELHHNFKRANGYSELEIAQKRNALENVLIPETLAQHRQRFAQAGFSHSDVWFQCFNFASMLATR